MLPEFGRWPPDMEARGLRAKGYPKKLVVLGGGTAGWMAATLLYHAWADSGTEITLIESGDIGTIGVGEGSTPFLREFFRTLGISESEWMPACSATYKCGIRFSKWMKSPENVSYFHPFFSKLDLKTGNAFFHNCGLRRRGKSAPVYPDDYFVSAALARNKRAPVCKEALPLSIDYAYHFDASLLGKFLKERLVKLGACHLMDKVESVALNDEGEIDSLATARNGILRGDFFVDCSGFAGILINKTLKEKFHSYRDNLFNDSAVAIATPLGEGEPLPSETVSEALKFGWAWKIPLTSRYGNGYVFSSDFISPDQAERELRAKLGTAAKGMDARHLKMRVGRVDNHWSKNCLAVGLSQGFIEPLEATTLMLIQFTVQHFIKLYEQGDFSAQYQTEFNSRINDFFEGVRDYIVTHYKTNTRDDTEYWIANREHKNISDNLKKIFQAWDSGSDFETVLTENSKALIYLRPSWYCILAGMERFPDSASTATKKEFLGIEDSARNYCSNIARKFYDHKEYLGLLKDNFG